MRLDHIAKYGDENMIIISIPSIQNGVTWSRGDFSDFVINNRNRLSLQERYVISRVSFLPNGGVLLEYSPRKSGVYSDPVEESIKSIKKAISCYEVSLKDIIDGVFIIRDMFDKMNIYGGCSYIYDGLSTMLRSLVYYSENNIDFHAEYLNYINYLTTKPMCYIPRNMINTPY